MLRFADKMRKDWILITEDLAIPMKVVEGDALIEQVIKQVHQYPRHKECQQPF